MTPEQQLRAKRYGTLDYLTVYFFHHVGIDVEKVIGVPPPELFSLHPLQSLYDACQLLVESRSHRLPLVDVDSETGEEMIVSVLTQYRILKFIAMNVSRLKELEEKSDQEGRRYSNIAEAPLGIVPR